MCAASLPLQQDACGCKYASQLHLRLPSVSLCACRRLAREAEESKGKGSSVWSYISGAS